MIISAVVLARYKSFNSTILLRNLAYEIALSTREAQVLGVSVQGEQSTINPFVHAYGMHFTTGTQYILFTDRNDNTRYDTGEELSLYTIGQHNAVSSMCANTNCTLTTLDVLFRRPEPDARFYTDPTVSSISSVRVIFGSEDGNIRTMRVWPTGQIAVE